MKLKLKKDNLLVLIYAMFVAVYTSPLFSVSIFNYLLTLLFYFNLVFIVLGFIYLFINEDTKAFIAITLITAVIIMICFINGTRISNLIIYLTLIWGMYYTTSISYTKDFFKLLCVVGLCYNLVSLIVGSSYFVRWTDSNEAMMNPNTIGIVNLFFCIIINSYINLFLGTHLRKAVVLYNALIIYILFIYRGRTSQFAYLVFLLLFILLHKEIDKKPKFLALIICVLIGIGLLFPFLYINMPKTIMEWIAKTTGKPYFSGRELIWARFAVALSDTRNLLIGPGSWRKAEFTTLWTERRVYSMHNNYLDIMLCFGIVGVIIYVFFSAWRIYMLSNTNAIRNHVCLIGYLSFIILGYSENTFAYAFFVIIFNILIGMTKMSYFINDN